MIAHNNNIFLGTTNTVTKPKELKLVSSRRKKEIAISYLKQRVSGATLAVIGVIAPIACNADATFSLLAIPVGIYLMFSKKLIDKWV